MGAVWRAHHLTLNSPVAVKLIDPRIASTGLGVERFVREARAAAALRSPHVVQTLDYGVHEGVPYIAMELMEGESLADRLSRLGSLSPTDAARFLTHVGRAVGKAHDAGIVHRDLKPDNIFLVHNDDEEVAKVLDFGIAKMTHPTGGASSQTETGVVIGTPFYMSPEQAGGSKIDHRADLWAMGVIAYQCLLGHLPFPGQALGEVIIKICTGPIPVPSQIGRVPMGFDSWFAKACARDPDQRFQSARQMTDAFRLLLTSRFEAGSHEPYSEASSTADPPLVVHHQTDAGVTKGTSTTGTGRQTRTLAIAAVVAAVALAGWGVFALVSDKTPTSPTPSATLATPSPTDKPAPPAETAKPTAADTAKAAPPPAETGKSPEVSVAPAASVTPPAAATAPAAPDEADAPTKKKRPPAISVTPVKPPKPPPAQGGTTPPPPKPPPAGGTPPSGPTDFGF
jgi:serine/threonine protein kinase